MGTNIESARPRVAQVSSVHKPFDTRIYEKISKTLVENGWSLLLIVSHDEELAAEIVRIKTVKKLRNRAVRATLGSALCMMSAIRSKAKIIHLHDPELILWIPILRLLGRKVIFDMHENTPANIRGKPWIPGFLRPVVSWLWLLIEWVFIRNTHVIFAEASYADDYPWITSTTIVQNYPKVGEFSPRITGNRKGLTLVYLGAVARVRGSRMMLDVVSRLQNEGYEVCLKCIGPVADSHLEELNNEIRKLGLQNVEFLGYQSPQRAWRLASSADVGLAILQPHPNYFRSYPTKMFEYMSMGLPVVVSDFPLYREVIEAARCGVCVQPDDVNAILRELRPILDSEELRIEMGTRGRRSVERQYSWEVEKEKLLDCYSSLAGDLR